jgi:hypothetical protein
LSPKTSENWNRTLTVLGLLALMVGFWFATRASYKSFFHPDDIDTMGWTHVHGWFGYLPEFFNLKFSPHNSRPTVHFLFYKLLDHWAPMNFPVWMMVLQAVHAFNIGLVFWLCRRSSIPVIPALLGTAFFAFHPACFPEYFRTMFAYDVFCATFCLGCLLLYQSGYWLPALLCMFAAYRAKEVAIAIPVVLLLWQLTRKTDDAPERTRWWHLLPFFALSLNFGWQALHFNDVREDSPYRFQWTLSALWTCIAFYSRQLFQVPFLGLFSLALPFWLRDRRILFGVVAMWVLLGPMLFLPERLNGAYLYVPLVGFSFALAAVWQRFDWRMGTASTVVWLGVVYLLVRQYRGPELYRGLEAKLYVQAIEQFVKDNPDVDRMIYENLPTTLDDWAGPAAARYFGGQSKSFLWIENPQARKQWSQLPVALMTWRPDLLQMQAKAVRSESELGYWLSFSQQTPIWYLRDGWLQGDRACRVVADRFSLVIRAHQGPQQLKVNLRASQPMEIRAKIGPTVDLGTRSVAATAKTPADKTPQFGTYTWSMPSVPDGFYTLLLERVGGGEVCVNEVGLK